MSVAQGEHMAMRSIWRGHLRLSLVTIGVRVYPATDPSGDIHFHQLHRKCQTRIVYRKWCPSCDREVERDEIVKGYEIGKGRYVALEEEDIRKVRPESTRIISVRQVAASAAIDTIWLDAPYFLAPDGKAAAEAFVVMREALHGKVAVGTVAFHGRERLVAIAPREKGLVMYTLRHADDVRDINDIPEIDDAPRRARPEEVTLARKVLGEYERPLDFASYRDTYEDALRDMIEAKVAGEEIVETEVKAPPKVVNLMEALRQSLAQASKDRKRPAKAGRKRTARVAKFPARRRAG
jgi:DNA end-binding protein Ku